MNSPEELGNGYWIEVCCDKSGLLTAAGNRLGAAWIGGSSGAFIDPLGFSLLSEYPRAPDPRT